MSLVQDPSVGRFTIEHRPTCTITATVEQLKLLRQAIDLAIQFGQGTVEMKDWDAAQLVRVIASDRVPDWLANAAPA